LAGTVVILSWIFYAATLPMLLMFWRGIPLPIGPITALEHLRIANEYGLFAVMTPNRYEIEFQGSNDGRTWVAYPFLYKPQDVTKAPGAIRLESVVRIVGLLDAVSNCAANRGDVADQRCGRAVVICRQSISRPSSATGARGALAVLVYRHGGEAGEGNLVASATVRRVRSDSGDWAGRKIWHGAGTGQRT
jgi:hypothetical protein